MECTKGNIPKNQREREARRWNRITVERDTLREQNKILSEALNQIVNEVPNRILTYKQFALETATKALSKADSQ